MKAVSQNYKNDIKELGKEITAEITYVKNSMNYVLTDEDILSANLHYDGGLLKSVMKQLDLELTTDLPVGTNLTYYFGIKKTEHKNLFRYTQNAYINDEGTVVENENYILSDYIEIDAYISYILSTKVSFSSLSYALYNKNKEFLYNLTHVDVSSLPYIFGGDIGYIRCFINYNNAPLNEYSLDIYEVQFEKGTEKSSYEKYEEYEKNNYGNFIVYSSEKQEDNDTYKIIAYDKMLNAMKDYEPKFDYILTLDTEFDEEKTYYTYESNTYIPYSGEKYFLTTDTTFIEEKKYYVFDGEYLVYDDEREGNPSELGLYEMYNPNTLGLYEYAYVPLPFPMTVRDYIGEICDKIGLSFYNSEDTFTNYDKIIENELYLDADGGKIGYTYRDVLDELAEVTASTICMKNGYQIEVKYLDDGNNTILDDFRIYGEMSQNGTPSQNNPVLVRTKTGSATFTSVQKNLLKVTATSSEINGINFTVNQDGSIIANGTATADATCRVCEIYEPENFGYKSGNYLFSGCSGGSDTTYSLILLAYNSGGHSTTKRCYDGDIICDMENEDDLFVNLTIRAGQTVNNIVFYPMLRKESEESANFEPYCETTYQIDLGNIELCKTQRSQDYIYKTGDKWYLHKEIDKLTFDGTETSTWSSASRRIYMQWANLPLTFKTGALYRGFSDYFPYSVSGATGARYSYTSTAIMIFFDSDITTQTQAQDWLSKHHPVIYGTLSEPVETEITDEKLLNQLNNIHRLEMINAEYLKDVNVNFGEMVKPINTVTFKRSADSDAISLSSPEDLSDEEKNEIVISENQILNGDNRDTYLKPILDRLYGISYATNDFNSTGITWLELCDRYNVWINKTDAEGNIISSNIYPCILFNDEINVNQGLEEIIHTELPEESTTDYNTTTKTDRLQKRTDLIVNKQEGYIEAITGELGMVDGESQVINGIVTKQTQNALDIEAITSYEMIDGKETLTGVKTRTGFTFNSKGLIIQSSENTYKAVHNEKGDYYYDGDTPLGETTNEGSKFKNMDLYGEFRYGKDSIDDDALFVSMKYTDDNNEVGFGHFWNGD